ncbi:MAG TPA: spore germination protein GerW family protein [Polyangiaceae bacterium]
MKNLVKGLLAELSKVSKSDAVVGGVRDAGKAKMIPLSRVSIGFGAGLGGVGGKTDRPTQGGGQAEAGGAGGAIVVEPRAFVVVGEDGLVHMLALNQGKQAVVRRGVEILLDHNEHLRIGDSPLAPLLGAKAKDGAKAGGTKDGESGG